MSPHRSLLVSASVVITAGLAGAFASNDATAAPSTMVTYVPAFQKTAIDAPREFLEPTRRVQHKSATDPSLLQTKDPRIRTIQYSPDAVVTIPVQRGVVTQIVLADDENIGLQPAMGKGADCARDTDTWCVIATGRDIFIKPKTGATTNNMALTASQRRYVFEFKVVGPGSMTPALMRLSIVPPPPPPLPPPQPAVAQAPIDLGPPPLTPKDLVANRMRTVAAIRNKDYSVAVGEFSDDIVPTMVFDDGTKTYFSFPNNRPLPTIFETLADQSEEMVNAHMEGDQLVVDRVSRRFVLRLGNSVAAIINEAFDIDGVAPVGGTTVPGVRRAMRSADTTTQAPRQAP
jgi:type IV secretion system protein VirB9